MQVTPGTIIFSRRHKCLLLCFGRNGGRPWQMLGHVVKNGEPDTDTCKIFEAHDVAAIVTARGLLHVLPGTVARTYDLPPVEDDA